MCGGGGGGAGRLTSAELQADLATSVRPLPAAYTRIPSSSEPDATAKRTHRTASTTHSADLLHFIMPIVSYIVVSIGEKHQLGKSAVELLDQYDTNCVGT